MVPLLLGPNDAVNSTFHEVRVGLEVLGSCSDEGWPPFTRVGVHPFMKTHDVLGIVGFEWPYQHSKVIMVLGTNDEHVG